MTPNTDFPDADAPNAAENNDADPPGASDDNDNYIKPIDLSLRNHNCNSNCIRNRKTAPQDKKKHKKNTTPNTDALNYDAPNAADDAAAYP